MKFQNNSVYKRIFSFLLIFISSISSIKAQGFDDDVIDNPAPAAPIDNWVMPMLLLGILLMFYFYKKRQTSF